MAKILVSGFELFGGESMDPVLEAVRLLPDAVAGADVVKLKVPVSFSRSVEAVREAIEGEKPGYVVCVGQAGGRSGVGVEKVAINLADARIPDNDGEQPCDLPLRGDGPAAYFATLPVKAMVEAVATAGIECSVSYSAGAYVCNALMYNVLYLLERGAGAPGAKAGFVHVPYAPEQLAGKPEGTPSMPVGTCARALEVALAAAVGDA